MEPMIMVEKEMDQWMVSSHVVAKHDKAIQSVQDIIW